jgi:hypothetical protein
MFDNDDIFEIFRVQKYEGAAWAMSSLPSIFVLTWTLWMGCNLKNSKYLKPGVLKNEGQVRFSLFYCYLWSAILKD